MGTSTLRNIKAALVALVAILGCFANQTFAQTERYRLSMGYRCCNAEVPIIDQGTCDGSFTKFPDTASFPLTTLSSADRPQSIQLFVVDADGTETLLDELNLNNAVDGASPNEYIAHYGDASTYYVAYEFRNTKQKYGATGAAAVNQTSQLKNLWFDFRKITGSGRLQNLDLLGHTLLVRLNMSKKPNVGEALLRIIDFYVDPIGNEEQDLEDESGSYLSTYDERLLLPCPGSGPVEMKVGNELIAYRDQDGNPFVSYLGNSYDCTFKWERSIDTWGRTTGDVSYTDSYVDAEVAGMTTTGSAVYHVSEIVRANGVSTGCAISLYPDYKIILFTPLQLANTFKNLNSGATATGDKFYACYGDDVLYTPTFTQQLEDGSDHICEDSEVYWSLCTLNDDGSVADTLHYDDFYYDGETFTLTNLTKTTTFQVTCEYIDPEGNSIGSIRNFGDNNGDHIGDENPCPTRETFTIEVRQVDATTDIVTPDHACAEDNVTISATVSNIQDGSTGADYAYRWFYSDDEGSTYVDLNTTNYLTSDDADWSDPTATVNTVYNNITYPFQDGTDDGNDYGPRPKFIKFQLANTYKVDGTTYFCPIPEETSFNVYKLPVLQDVDDVYACKDQKVSFQVNLASGVYQPDAASSKGMTYEVFTDEACTTKATNVINLSGGATKDVTLAEGDDDTNTNRLNTTGNPGAYAWFGLKSLDQDSYTFYVRVLNEESGCYSKPVKVEIKALPLPELDDATVDPFSFCRDADASPLVVEATLKSDFDNYYTANPSLTKPSVTFHWSWADANNNDLGSTETTDNGKLTGAEAGNFAGLTQYAGYATVKVWTTSSDNCGYNLDYNGKPTSTTAGDLAELTREVSIAELPLFDIETGVKACADQGNVDVKLSSLDYRDLTFTFTPVGSAPAPTNASVDVAGNGHANFSTTVNKGDVKDITVYEYDVLVQDHTYLTCQNSGKLSFTAYPVPELVITPADGVRYLCKEETITLDVEPSILENGAAGNAANYKYVWNIDGSDVATTKSYDWTTSTATSTGNHTVTVTVTYTFTDGHACSTTESFELYVNERPEIDFQKDQTICEGNDATLTAAVTNPAAANYDAKPSVFSYNALNATDGSAITGTDDGTGYGWTFSVSPVNTTSYSIVVTNETTGCVSDEARVTVTVNRKARVSLTSLSETQVCEGDNTIDINYTLDNPTEATLDFASLVVNGFTIVSYDDAKITVNAALPVGSINFQQADASATVGGISASTGVGCDVIFSNKLTIKVNAIPAAPVVTRTPIGDEEVCLGESKTFTFDISGKKSGFRYEYFISDTEPAADATPTATFTYPNVRYSIDGSKLTNSIKVWVRAIDTNNPTNCTSEFAGPFDIIVNKVETPVAPAPATICEGETATITVTSPLSDATHTYTYKFTSGSGDGQSSHSESFTTKALTESTTYYVQVVHDEKGCTSDRIEVAVDVHKKPVGSASVEYQGADGSSSVTLPDASVVARQAFCQGDEGTAIVTLSAKLQNASDSFTSNLEAVSVGNVSDWVKVSETEYSCNKTSWDADVTLTFSVNDGSCGSETFTTIVKTVSPLSKPVVTTDFSEFCEYDDKSVTISALPYADKTSDVNFVFYVRKAGETAVFKGPFFSTSGSISKKTLTDLAIDSDVEIYAYAYNVKTGCMSPVSDVASITVNRRPVPTVTADPAVVCPNGTSSLSTVEAFNKFEWLDYETKGTIETFTTPGNSVVTVTVPETRTYRVVVTDEKGCESDPASVTVTVHPRPAFDVVATPDVVCQGSDDRVEFVITPKNDDVIDFELPYTFTTHAPSTKTIQTTTDALGNTIYFVDGEVWNESSVTFSFSVSSTAAYNSCLSEEVDATVTVVPALAKPEPYAIAPQDGSLTRDVHVCYGTTDPLTISIDNISAYPTSDGTTYSYHWYSDAAGTNELVNGTDYTVSADGTLVFVPTTDMTIYAKVIRETTPNCESAMSEVVKLTIEPLPATPVANAPVIYICQPEEASATLDLTVQSAAADYIYHWYAQNAGEVDDDMSDDVEVGTAHGTTPVTIPNPEKTTYYYVIAESKYGCLSSGKSNVVTATVGTNPEIVSVTSPEESVCSGSSIDFSVGVSGDATNITYYYEVSTDDASIPTTSGYIDASGEFSAAYTPTNTTVYTITVWALYDGHCKSLNSVTHVVTVRGLPTVNSIDVKSNVCASAPFSVTLNGVTSHDLASCADPANAQLEVVIVDNAGNELASEVVKSDSDVEVTYANGITRSMLPVAVKVRDISTKWSTSCDYEATLSVAVVDIPEFNLINNDGKVDQTPTSDEATLDYCVDENLNFDIETALPTVDADGRTITYTYQWRFEGANIVGEVNTDLHLNSLTTANSGKYELVVKTTDGDCEYVRAINVTVHELPAPVIIPGNALDIYCTDGYLNLSTNDDFVSYHWVIKGNTDIDIYKDSPDVTLSYKISDIDLPAGADFVDVNLYATSKYGCVTKNPTVHSVILSNPPVISAVTGTETCGSNPFYIKVSSNSPKYTAKIFDTEGREYPVTENISATDTTYVTPSDLSEGDYVVELTDVNTGCTSTKGFHLSRYEISLKISPRPNRYFCFNNGVSFDVNISDDNGHDDFLSKIESATIKSHVEMESGTYMIDQPDVTVTSNPVNISFDPRTLSPVMEPSSSAPYTIKCEIVYTFKGGDSVSTTCTATKAQNFYILPVPELVSSPEMPVCLRSDVEFKVLTDNIDDAWTKQFQFFINGVQVVNASGDYTSNIFRTVDHPEISLNEGDVVTAEVIMDGGDHTCTSEPIVVSFKGDFKPELKNVDGALENCKGAPINFTVESVTPDGADASFVLNNFKAYEVYLIDNGVESKVAEYSGLNTLSHDGSFVYNGDNSSISFYAVVTDINDCVVNTQTVTVKVNQFKIVDVVVTNEASEVMNTNDLCADINYTYTAVLQDADGNVITPGADFDFTFTIDGVEWSDHSAGSYTLDYVTKSHAVTTAPISLVVNAKNLVTGCETNETLALYLPYSEEFSYHAKPTPNEKLKDSFNPVSTDVADTAKFEICFDDDFGFDVNGSIVTVVYDGVKVATYRNGSLDATLDESTISTSNIHASYESGISVFLFDIDPSDNFHSVSFIVSDGTCEVATNDWLFRKFQDIDVIALDESGNDILANDVATICEDQTLNIVPSTSETGYTRGYIFTLDGVDVSATDFSELSYLFQNATKGEYNLVIRPDFGTNACSKSITIRVEEAPKPTVSLKDADDAELTPTATSVNSWTYSFCEDIAHNLVLGGAANFEILSVTRDGVDVTADFNLSTGTASDRSISWSLSLSYVANTNSEDYSTYTFNFQFSVGTCVENATVTTLVYKKPDASFINGTPLPLVISGAEVPVEVTPGYARYEFYVNGTLVQDGTSSTLAGDQNVVTEGTVDISVTIHNTFGCTQTITAQTTVLEGILPKTITTSSDYYCTDEPGVKISVVDSQLGVTYYVDGVASLLPIKVTAADQEVAWEPVRLTDASVANPETFTVKAYYDALPTQIFDMANTVEVEEVKSPSSSTTVADLIVTDCSVAQSSSFSWSVENTETDIFYVLVNETEGNTEISTPVPGTGSTLVIPVYDIMTTTYGAAKNGVYRVIARSKRLNGDFACDKVLDGSLTINLPSTNAYAVSVTPESGNVCVDDQNFTITLENSDFDSSFTHEYILYRDGVDVDHRFSDAHGGKIEFRNADLGSLTAGTYTYSVVCSFSGCLQPMANNVTVTVYDKPTMFPVSAANDGYYCHDDEDGVTITVDGSQDGLIYKLINKVTGDVVAQELGHADGSAIEFLNILKGEYYVEVSIPNTEGCVTVLNDVTVAQLAEPATINATISEVGSTGAGSKDLTICVEKEYQITVSGADFDKSGVVMRNYELYDASGNLISTDMNGCGTYDATNGTFCFPIMQALTPGTYSFDILAKSLVNISDGSTLECSKMFVGVVTLTVKDHSVTGEYLTLDLNPHPEIDCYGSDITVENPNLSVTDSVEYRLFKVDEHGDYNALAPISVIKPYAGDDPVFKNIKDALGDYIVRAYNGACDELVGTVHIENDRFAQMQELEFDSFVCEGDGGVKARMKDSEKDVTYTLYFISPELYKTINPENTTISTTTLAENLWGQMMGSVTATYDHERLTFSQLDYGDGNLVDLITKEGYYYVTSVKSGAVNPCPTASPLVQYVVLDLPKSFSVEKSNLYCDPTGTNDVYIENAEYDPEATITYSLWKLDELGNATYYDEVVSNSATDKPLYFPKKATEGTYYAIAAKQYSDKFGGKICTSRMRSELKLVYAPVLDPLTFADTTLQFCSDDNAQFSLNTTELSNMLTSAKASQSAIKGIKLHLTEYAMSPADDESNTIAEVLYDGSSDAVFSDMPTGNFTIWASWASDEPEDFNACLVAIGNVNVNKYQSVPSNVINAVACNNSYTLDAAYYVEGATYKLLDADGNVVKSVVYDATTSEITFSDLASGDYIIVAGQGDGSTCEVSMGKLLVRGLPTGAQEHEVSFCAGEQVSYTLPSSLLFDGAYYYVTDDTKTPQDYAGELHRYQEVDGTLVLNNLSDGVNNIWVAFNGFECLTKVDIVNVTRYAELPSNVIDAVACDNSYTVDSAYYVEGATYKLLDADGNVVKSVVYDATTTDITFSDLAAGNYTIFVGHGDDSKCEVSMGKLLVRGLPTGAQEHEVSFCAGEQVSYTLPSSLLFDGAYYYVTDDTKTPQDYAGELHRYQEVDGTLVLNNLSDGVNNIWVAFNGFECLTKVDVVNVTRYAELPSNVIDANVCGLQYEVDNAYLVNGATYELYSADGSKVDSQTYTDASTALSLTALVPGDYVIRISLGTSSCESVLGKVTFRGEIDATNPISATIVVCGASNATFTLTADAYVDKLVEGLVYYVVEQGQTPSGILTTGRKYVAGQEITFRGLTAGDYKIWASFDGYGCEVEVGDVHVTDAEFENIELIASLSCDNELTFSTDTSYVGISYQLFGLAKDKSVIYTSEIVAGTGSAITWPVFDYIENVNRYEVRATAGTCPETVVGSIYNGGILQDFDPVISNFTSNGGQCSGNPISLVLSESVEGLNYYLTIDPEDERTPLAGTEKVGTGSSLTWVGASLPAYADTTVTYYLHVYKGNLATTTCINSSWAGIKINYDDTTYPVGHLVAKNDVLDYCQGEIGIRLGYINQPRVGELYRLYKKSDDIWGKELVDIQEIPSYNDVQPAATDTLFFNGWGYNESSKDYATSGIYWVEVESAQGCLQQTDSIEVIENPLPIQETDSVYAVLFDKDGVADYTTVNKEYGVMGGSLVYSKGRVGYSYYLLFDGEAIPGAVKTPTVEGDVVFGPIYDVITDTVTVNDTIKLYTRQDVLDDGIYWGEGVYSVMAVDNTTQCSSELGNITFVAEELTAYNVYIYLNKGENARTINLVPAYEADTDIAHKGNHMYIDWSSRCDRVYCPAITTGDDGYYINDEQVTESYNISDNPNYFLKGYSNIRGSYDSKYQKYTGKSGAANVWFNIVQDSDKKIAGTYGFINVDHTTNDSSAVEMSTQTGYFFYMKQPSFYGHEEIEYYVENRQLPNRISNIAKIEILCGNEETGDNESVFLIPNAFSPNGDGYNDYFKIIIPDRYKANSESKLQVFNRWGTLVYRSSGLRYGEDENWWDGTSSTSNMVTLGQNLPSGTYYYVFTITFIDKQHATRSERKMHGYVELRR